MNRKKLIGALLVVGMMAMGLVEKAQAYTDALLGNNTAQITITIRPNVDRSVTITTDNVNMDLGYIDLTGSYSSTQTVSPATVTIGGTFGNTDLLLSADINGGWNFDASSDTLNQNALATWVTFTDVNVAAAPAQDANHFFGVDGTEPTTDLLAAAGNSYPSTRVGTNAATAHGIFEDNTISMNGLTVGAKRHMWMKFRMPSDTTVTDEQKVTFVLTVDTGI